MIVRITQTVVTDIDVPANDPSTAINMVKRQQGEEVDKRWGKPEFQVIEPEE